MADPDGGRMTTVWQLLVGPPRTALGSGKERITPVQGLSALSLDALTSVAYGPEAIILVLAVAGAGALHLVLPITLAIVALLAILVFSYRQVIDAYPRGGGAYAVSRANFGAHASLVAGASLVVDYTLTVAVSIAAGVAGLDVGLPEPDCATVPLCLGHPRLHHAAQPAGPRRDGTRLPAAHDGVHRRAAGHHRHRPRSTPSASTSPARDSLLPRPGSRR